MNGGSRMGKGRRQNHQSLAAAAGRAGLSAAPWGLAWLLALAAVSHLHAQSGVTTTAAKRQSDPLYRATQQALDSLTRAEIDREEACLGSQSLDGLRKELRATISQLQSIGTQLTAQLLQSYRQPLSAQANASWSTQELESLQRNLKVQLARAYRNQALCYPADSLDQINALSLALEQLPDLVTLAHDEASVWQARVEQVICLRLLKRTVEAQQQIKRWQDASPPVKTASRLTREALLIDLEEGDIQQALAKVLLLLDDENALAATVPETDDAILEILLTARLRATPSQVTQLTQRATRQLQRIASMHGPYWKRRAEVRCGQALIGQDAARADTNEPALLSHAATGLYAAGKPGEAVALYDRIAALFAAQADENRRFQTLQTAAAVVSDMKQHVAALRRFRSLALEHPQHAEAAATHLIAIGLAAQLARDAKPAQRGGRFELYLELLGEHLQQWPQQPSAATVEQWLARTQRPEVQRRRAQMLAESGNQPQARQQALTLYGQLVKDAPDDAELLEAYARLLARGSDKTELSEALRLWQIIEKRSQPGGPRWSRGRRARLELLEQLGEGERAERLRQLTEILYQH